MFGLSVDSLRKIREAFAKFPQIQKVVLYGSRAKGNYRTGSDIDITLIGKNLTLTDTVYPLMSALDDLYLPYKFDISIFSQLGNTDFIDHILRVGKTFYQREGGMEGWADSTIGKVCKVVAGQSPKGTNYNDAGDGLPFYQGKKQFRDRYVGAPEKWTTQITREAYAGDILMSVRAPVGPINFATEQICIGRGLAAIRTGEQIHREFLFYVLLSMQDQIHGNKGAVFDSINKKQIESIPIPLPPLPVQKRIVAILDEAFAAIATATTNTEMNLANAQELFDNELNRVFQNPVSADAGRDKGEAVKDAEFARLGDVCKIAKTRHDGKMLPYVGMENIESGTGQLVSEPTPMVVKSSTFRFHEVHVLYGRLRPYLNKVLLPDFEGHCSTEIFPFECSPHLARRFLFYWLTCESTVQRINRTSTGARMPRANVNAVLDFNIPLPPLSKQERIVAILDKLSAKKQSLVGIYQRKLTTLTELKQSLLHKAFTGELTADPKATNRTLSKAGV